MKWIKRILLVVLVLTPAALILFAILTLGLYTIGSSSMEPAILVGDRIVVRVVKDATPKRGEMFVFRRKDGLFIQRVVAVAGDRVRIHDKKLFVNGQEQREPYVTQMDSSRMSARDDFPAEPLEGLVRDAEWIRFVKASVAAGEVVVPAGSSFALGDSRDNSLDSRFLGFYRNDTILAKPVMVLYSQATTHSDKEFRWERLFKAL